MRKLLIAEAIAIALSVAIVTIGSIMGWPEEVTVGGIGAVVTVVVAVTVVVVVVSAMAVTPIVFVVAPIAVGVGVVTVGVVILMAVDTIMAVIASIAIIALVVNQTILIILDELEIKYRWAFLSLLSEGVIVWAVLFCGPSLIKTIMGQ